MSVINTTSNAGFGSLRVDPRNGVNVDEMVRFGRLLKTHNVVGEHLNEQFMVVVPRNGKDLRLLYGYDVDAGPFPDGEKLKDVIGGLFKDFIYGIPIGKWHHSHTDPTIRVS